MAEQTLAERIRELSDRIAANIPVNIDLEDVAQEVRVAAGVVQHLMDEHTIMYRRLIGKPDLKCQKCGGYADGSGQWACPHCGTWHYLTGSFKWPVDTPQAKEWMDKRSASVDAYLSGAVEAVRAEAKEEKHG